MPLTPHAKSDDCIEAEFVEANWLDWVAQYFPHVASSPMGERHRRLWNWFESLVSGVKLDARVEIWPRGGAKSTTVEMAVAYIGEKGTRRYVLYVSETQDQADKHVAAIATLLEKRGIQRSLNQYGNSKGWRRNQLRTANGFNVEALGLDTAARGIKLDEFRPDLIIFDDIDNQKDSPKITAKKEQSIKSSIIPAGSSDCAVLFIQNMIMEDGIVAKLYDGRADFLLNRDVPEMEVAVKGLVYEMVEHPDKPGRMIPKILEGEPTWEGQNLAICEGQMVEWGPMTFLRESQHEVAGKDGIFFQVSQIAIKPREELPKLVELCRAWDFAATEGGGDYTVGALWARTEHETYGVLDIARGQWGSDKVTKSILDVANRDKEEWGAVTICIPRDPGAAGKSYAHIIAAKLRAEGHKVIIVAVNGKKALRARPQADEINSGNVWLLDGKWNHDWKEEHRKFREDDSHDYDDQVDAGSDAFNKVNRRKLDVF